MEIHLTKHHQSYVNNLNNALPQYEEVRTEATMAAVSSARSFRVSLRTPSLVDFAC
jgi:superoxide dismutase